MNQAFLHQSHPQSGVVHQINRWSFFYLIEGSTGPGGEAKDPNRFLLSDWLVIVPCILIGYRFRVRMHPDVQEENMPLFPFPLPYQT